MVFLNFYTFFHVSAHWVGCFSSSSYFARCHKIPVFYWVSYIYTKTSKNTKPPYPSGFWLILQCFLCVLRRSLDVIHSMFNVIFNSINHFTLKLKKNNRKLNSKIWYYDSCKLCILPRSTLVYGHLTVWDRQ